MVPVSATLDTNGVIAEVQTLPLTLLSAGHYLKIAGVHQDQGPVTSLWSVWYWYQHSRGNGLFPFSHGKPMWCLPIMAKRIASWRWRCSKESLQRAAGNPWLWERWHCYHSRDNIARSLPIEGSPCRPFMRLKAQNRKFWKQSQPREWFTQG